MTITQNKYSPSINILRDSDFSFNYIPTTNATHAFNSIFSKIQIGGKSHNIIGAYGTGKSSFLLALIQTLKGKASHFPSEKELPNGHLKYEFITLIGEYGSLQLKFAQLFNLSDDYTVTDIITALDKKYSQLDAKQKGLFIIIDEFGKFLEYAAKNNPEAELYFIQQLAEWINDVNKHTHFITVLHQNFNAYSIQLDHLQRQEWEKIKGRFIDIPFNEPVEQLLYLASERLDQKNTSKLVDKNFDRLFDVIKEAKAFPLKDYLDRDFAKKLYPFDILSASILTLSLQKYGQNERSLFSFIETKEHLRFDVVNQQNSANIHIPALYNYLLHDYYTFLTSKYNPDYSQWSAIRRALERIEGLFSDASQQKNAEDILKLIGLLNIFATHSAKLEPRFYANYARLALSIKSPEDIIRHLEKKKIIRFVNHNLRYILFEGTDLDIELAIDDAGRLVEKVTNVVNHLNQYFEFPFISARSIYYKTGTPRFFQFKLTDRATSLIPEGEVDGFINLVFSEEDNADGDVKEFSDSCSEAILFGYYKNTGIIRNLLFDIQKIQKVIENNQDDKAAIVLLNEEFQIKIKLLNHYVLDNIYTDKGNVVWYFQGRKIRLENRKKLNRELSKICAKIYDNTPIYKNELINKTKVSGQIALARNKLNRRLLSDLNLPNLGFNDNEFPPEKSTYLSLLKHTGIHQITNGIGALTQPTHESFRFLWEAGINFLNSSKNKERNLEDFIQTISSKPFKLKRGLIDYWVPVFLLANKDDFALYTNGVYVPEIESDILELINKKPSHFFLKAFDVEGVKLKLFNHYRIFLDQSENHKPNNKLFIQTIKPFLVFYRDLTEYAQKTTRLSKKTIALRQVIANAKDPEKTFFEDFPAAMGYTISELQKEPLKAETFIQSLQTSVREIRSSYDMLVDRFETYLVRDVIGSGSSFPEYREDIRERFKNIKVHLLLARQKPFYSRLQSELDDRTAWLNSIAQSCIGKPLNAVNDEEEILLFERLKDIIYELDNLSEINQLDVDQNNEDLIKIEITSLMQGLNKGLLRIPKEKSKEVVAIQDKIRLLLGTDKKINLTILAKLLQEYI